MVEARPTSVRLRWRSPRDQFDVESYEVRYYVRGSKNSSQVLQTRKEAITVSGLTDGISYGFEVRTQTASQGWGDFSQAKFATPGKNGIIENSNEIHDPIYQVTDGQEGGEQVHSLEF